MADLIVITLVLAFLVIIFFLVVGGVGAITGSVEIGCVTMFLVVCGIIYAIIRGSEKEEERKHKQQAAARKAAREMESRAPRPDDPVKRAARINRRLAKKRASSPNNPERIILADARKLDDELAKAVCGIDLDRYDIDSIHINLRPKANESSKDES